VSNTAAQDFRKDGTSESGLTSSETNPEYPIDLRAPTTDGQSIEQPSLIGNKCESRFPLLSEK
jgi:hypothetical protein